MVPTSAYYDEIMEDCNQKRSLESVRSSLADEIRELDWITLFSDWELAIASNN